MNRTFALLLASALLVAHMLAIHKGLADTFAPPYEIAHVALRLARNLVQTGSLAWDPGGAPVEGYPSLAWVLLATVPEALSLPAATFLQALSALFALSTVWVLARFSPVRLAGVIAPLLFVASGAAASAASSGTEMTLAGLLVTAAFLAYEHERPRTLALLLALLCVTRPEGAALVGVLLCIELFRRVRPRDAAPRRALLAPFVAPALVIAGGMGARLALTGQLLSPWARALLDPDRLQPLVALRHLADFFTTASAGMLAIFPAWYLLRGMLTGTGTRALVLTTGWCALATLGGGGPQPLPYSQFMVPILAVMLVAVQEAMTVALDSKRRWLPQVTWVLFVLGLVVSVLGSKFPGDLGPLPTDRLHRAWMQSGAPRPFDRSSWLGRNELDEEIKATSRLRELARFLRDNLEADHSVLTPWPGVIGDLTTLRVIDAQSRVTPMPGNGRVQPWGSLGSWDLLAVLELRADYIVPTLGRRTSPPGRDELVELWSRGLDRDRSTPGRQQRLRELLDEYELITVPAGGRGDPGRGAEDFHLLRRRDLRAMPELRLRAEGGQLVAEVGHASHQQLVDLLVEVAGPDGERWRIGPRGDPGQRADQRARRAILLFPTGERRVELLRTALPQGLEVERVRAVLLNPGAADDDDPVCAEATLTLD
jgi:hypothetical protein